MTAQWTWRPRNRSVEELKNSRESELPEFDHGDLPSLEEQQRIIADTRREFNEWLSAELGTTR